MLLVLFAFGSAAVLSANGQQEGAPESGAEAPAPDAAEQGSDSDQSEKAGVPEDLKGRFSYAFGYLSAQNFAQQGIDIDIDYFAQAMKDAVGGNDPAITIEAMNQALQEYQAQLQQEQRAKIQAAAEENLKKANDILSANRENDAITETESGLQYEVIENGDSEVQPGEEDVVKVHYEGTLASGQVFDSSYERGEPVTFPLNGVIPGWTEGLQLMHVGDTYRFFIPPQLAYGEQGNQAIGPNELLIFEVELLEVNPDDGAETGEEEDTE